MKTCTFSSDHTQSDAASFITTTGTVTFAARSETATKTITPTEHTVVDGDRAVILTVTSGTGCDAAGDSAPACGNIGTRTGTIANDNAATLTLGGTALKMSSTFKVTLSNPVEVGSLLASELDETHALRWLDRYPEWRGTRRVWVIAVTRVFNWTHAIGTILSNPLRSLKKPPQKSRECYLTKSTPPWKRENSM